MKNSNYLNIFASYKNKTAIVDENSSYTYDEFVASIKLIAANLQKCGINKGDKVAIELIKCKEYLAIYFAISLIGAVAVPINITYPKSRIDFIEKDADVKLVTNKSFLDKLEKIDDFKIVDYDETDPCLIIYTSGSTGNPKGVIHNHLYIRDAIENEANNFANEYVTKNHTYKFSVLPPFSFVASWHFCLSQLLLGNEIYLVDDSITKDINLLCEYFSKNKIDASYIPPRLIKFILSKYDQFKIIYTGSERISNIYSDKVKIINLYGSSETFPGLTSFVIDKAYDNTPLGKIRKSMNGYILNDENEEVDEGELCISGNLFLGYNKLKEQTDKVLIPNPFKEKDGFAFLYRSGDIVKKDDNGNLVFVNRKDWMVKINGQRVEILEIENVLKALDGIENAVIKHFASPNGQMFLLAYYVLNKHLSKEDILSYLKSKLADYMVPAFLIELDEFPLNQNGKLDTKALPMPSLDSFKNEYEEPINEIEKKLCAAFETILKISHVGRKDDFFLMGGDSIKMMELQCLLEEYALSTKIIYEGRTPEQIALLVNNDDKAISFEHIEKENYSLSSSQLGVYLDFIKDKNSLKYNNPFIIKLDKYVDIDKLKHSLQLAFENHDAYRCIIKDLDGLPMMVKKEFNFVINEISGNVDEIINDLVKPFDIANGPLYRLYLISSDDKYLFIDVHHLVFDGTSLAILLKEINQAYEGRVISDEQVSIFDIALYEEKLSIIPDYKKAEEMFDAEFDGKECSNALPIDLESKVNSADEINKNTKESIPFIHITNFVKKMGITENTLFLAAYLYTLAIFNGDDKAFVCIGESGRHEAKLNNTNAMMVKQIPFHFELDKYKTVAELLFNVENKFRKYVNNDLYPFAKLANKFGFSNDFSFVYQADNSNRLLLNDKVYPIKKIKVNSAISNIVLMVFKEDDNFLCNFTYRSDLYYQNIIESFADTYVQVLKEMLFKNELDDITLLSEKALKHLDSVNGCESEYDNVDLITLFKSSVSNYPNNIAISYLDRQYTYKEANCIVNKIANYIKSLKLKDNKIGAIMIPRSEYMYLASLGVLAAGLGFQPLDSSYPKERLNFMVNDSGAKILITTEELRPLLDEYKGEVLYLKDIPNLKDDNEPNIKITPNDIFVMLYTSGTTGKPKGVILEHHNWVAFYNYDAKACKVDSTSRIACYASYGFDASIRDLFLPIIKGGASYIVPEDIRLDLEALNKWYIDNKITHGIITTQVGRKFYQASDSKYLKNLIVGGEKLVPIYSENQFDLINAYGPTETTVYITCFKVDKLYKRVPIGKTNDNNKCYAVDKKMRLVPFGAIGELLVAGDQVSRGYHNREEANKKVFIVNPFNDNPRYQKIYKTGDTIRLLDDGTFDFLGRNDGQVKIRGFRVELSEVEKIIREFKGILDAAVIDFEKPSGGKFIAAYLVSNSQINIDELKAFILKNKPSYMVPEVIMQIDKIPLNQNQKVNKKALPTPTFSSAKAKSDEHCDSYIVSKLKEALKGIVGEGNISYDDNLFNVGLTSITLMELSSAIAKLFNVSLSIKDLLDDCSLKHIEQLIIVSLINNVNKVEQKEEKKQSEYPLSLTQNGIYVEYIKDRTSLNYNIPMFRIFKKEKYATLTVDILKAAIKKVFENHLCLKASINANKDNQIVMIPHDEDEVIIDVIKGSKSEFEQYKEKFVRPFELDKCCYHISIFEGDDIVLFLDIHHIIFDGSSSTIFMRDLDLILAGKNPPKEDCTIYDVSLKEKELLKTDSYQKAKEYYDNLFADIEGSSQIIEECYLVDAGKEEISFTTNDIDLNKINAFIEQRGLSKNVFYLATFGLWLNKFTYNDTSCFVTVYNGRKDLKQANTIGMMVKTLPFVASIANNPTIDEFFAQSKTQILNNMANDIYSFADMAKENNINAELMFIYQGLHEQSDIYPLPLKDSKASLSIEVRDDENNIYLHIEYDASKYSKAFINRLIKSYLLTCKSIINLKHVNDVSLIDDEDKNEILSLVTNEVEYDKTPVIINIEQTMKLHPTKKAVICEDDYLTYEQLDKYSLNLAGYMCSLGIKNEDVVSIMVPRSVYMVLCSVGVLRAGAAYQPLDTSYPKERLNFMISDSGAKLLITSHELRPLVDEYKGNVLFIEDIKSLPEVKELNVKHGMYDKFIMLYTSGTTGTPKGVILENINLSCLASYYVKAKEFDENVIEASYASYGFDACLLDFYPTLLVGGSIHIISEDLRLNFPKLIKYYEDNKITNSEITTQVGRQIALTLKSKYFKKIGMGGEKLVPFDPSGISFEVYNQYGPSECTSYSNEKLVDKLYRRIPLGKANQNLHVYVVDKNLNLLPIGAIGELLIAGEQVGRGYLNRPEKTASVFIDNKYSDNEKYKRVYRTGDVTRMLEDGSIDFIGRNDGQVKVRGFRIELSEVEEIIRRYPGILDATTNAYDDPAGGKFIAAYIVAKSKIDINALNEFIVSEKPAYMVPKVTMQIDKIPLNVNSKVDKRKLPLPDLSTLQNEYVEPTNDLEREFCHVFAGILGLKKVGATDDFFALGGSSIGAAKIVGHAFTKGYDIVFKNVFENSTPRALAEFIAKENNLTLENDVANVENAKISPEELFKHNVIDEIDKVEQNSLGGVLLLGATGYLGMHVLKELLDNSNESVYCLVRENELNSSKDRLLILLEYYFENTYEQLLDKRLFILSGDILDDNLDKIVGTLPYKTIINCAASVKHFSNDNIIQKTNAGGVANLIKVALKNKKRLIHVSTLSVAGESVNNSLPLDFKLKENMLDVGQALDNKYIKSKFDAETEIKEAIKDGLEAKIIRVGNLMSRHSDGEFQINFFSNNFMNTFKAFQLLHCIPYEMLIQKIELSPVDLVAKAAVLLAKTNEKFNVFHVNNVHTVQMNNIVEQMNKNNINIARVDAKTFANKLNEGITNSKDTQAINSLLAYRSNRNENRRFVETDNAFTLEILYRLGFVWPMPDEQYLEKLINALIGLDFFEKNKD